jgi:hypothetical protein
VKKLTSFLFIVLIVFKGNGQKNPCNDAGVPYSSLPGDTTIVLKSGTTLTFNRCEFFDVKDCIEIKDIETPEDMERERLEMYDDRGNQLLSYGMIVIQMDSCIKKIFEVPVKFRMKIGKALACVDTVTVVPLLFLNGSSGWARPKDIKSRVVTINGEKYVEFETRTPVGAWNLDVLKNGRPVKFIAPKGYTIVRVKIGVGCPLFFVDEYPYKDRRSVKIKLRCANPARVFVDYTIYNRNKDTSLIKRKTFLDFVKHGNSRLKCTVPKQTFFGRMFDWTRKSRGELRRKYYLFADK